MKAEILSRGIVMREPVGDYRYFGWPTVIRLDDGRLMVAASGPRAGHVCPFGKSAISYSTDHGVTWSDYRIVTDSPLDDRDTGLVNLGGGKIALTWFTNSVKFQREWAIERHDTWRELALRYLDTVSKEGESRFLGSLIRYSNDNGETWGDEIKVPVSAPHGFRVLRDGTYFYLGKDFVATADGSHDESDRQVSAYASSDGVTWEYRGFVPRPEGIHANNCYEPHVIEGQNGQLLGFIRVQNVEGHPFSIFRSVSEDGGKTWSVMQPTGLEGAPPHLLRHSSGALLCSFAERRDGDSCQKVAVSFDDGEAWEQLVIDDRSETSDLGYPSTAECDDGTLVTVYYQRLDGDDKTSVLYTKWKLEFDSI